MKAAAFKQGEDVFVEIEHGGVTRVKRDFGGGLLGLHKAEMYALGFNQGVEKTADEIRSALINLPIVGDKDYREW